MIDSGGSVKKPGVYIIAEMACAHEGDLNLALKIIAAAGKAGADAIQFQILSLADLFVPYHSMYQQLTKIELSARDWSSLADSVRKNYPGMQIVACVYEQKSVDLAESINVDAYKLHSGDLSNPYIIKHVALTGKRIDLSIGASTLDEIGSAIELIKNTSNSQIWLMYGYQDFPTRPDDVHLRYMMKLQQLFELPIGYQDHSDGDTEAAFWLPAAALGLGVKIIEKHVTHDRSCKGVDHEAALNPDEFIKFVKMIRQVESALGIAIPKPFSPEELEYRKNGKKSLVAKRDVPAGDIITEKDLLCLRANELGLPPDKAGHLIGRETKRRITAYHLICEEDVL